MLEGVPDYRDEALSNAENEQNRRFAPVFRAPGPSAGT